MNRNEIETLCQRIQTMNTQNVLETSFSILKKLSTEDRIILMLFIGKETPAFTETQLFGAFASDPEIEELTQL